MKNESHPIGEGEIYKEVVDLSPPTIKTSISSGQFSRNIKSKRIQNLPQWREDLEAHHDRRKTRNPLRWRKDLKPTTTGEDMKSTKIEEGLETHYVG